MKLTKEIKIALVAIVGILIMYFGINFLKGMNLFSTNNAYYMTFDDIQGLGASTPIYADGYKVGIVDGLEYDYKENGPIKVKVDIIKDLRIPQGSKAEIVKDLMGNLQVNLLLANNPRERVEPGGIIPGAVNGGMMDKAANLVPVVEKMLPKLDSILQNPQDKPDQQSRQTQQNRTVAQNKPAQQKANVADAPVFKLQIFVSNRTLRKGDAHFKGETGYDSYQEGNMVKYTMGASTNYNEIFRLRKTLAEKFPEAFIIAFKNGKKYDVNQAIREFKQNRNR